MPHRPPADERSVIRHRGETAPNTLRSSPQIRFTLAPMSFRGAGSAGKFTQPAQAWLRVPASPESITPAGGYGFRLSPLLRLGRNDEQGWTSDRLATRALPARTT